MESQECTEEKPNTSILMLGLDDAGKTTLLYKLKQGDGDLLTIPTIGYNLETIEYEQHNYVIWDVGGLTSVRVLWKFYKANKSIVVFVVDATNSERFEEARKFLQQIMSDEDLCNAKLLVLSNKQDKVNCVADKDLEQELDLQSLKQPYSIIGTSAFDCNSLNAIMMHLKSNKE